MRVTNKSNQIKLKHLLIVHTRKKNNQTFSTARLRGRGEDVTRMKRFYNAEDSSKYTSSADFIQINKI